MTVPGYCANVHPGRTLQELRSQLDRHAVATRRHLVERGCLSPSARLDVGLWFPSPALHELQQEPDGAARLAEWLLERGLRVASFNGFPYGDFHAQQVKHAVYEPDWSRAERLLHTQALAEVLAELRRRDPDGVRHGEISTVPLGWRPFLPARGSGAGLGLAATHLRQLVHFLDRLESRTGVRVQVDLEPEPGCFLDLSSQLCQWFDSAMPAGGHPDPRRYLGVCHDVCHAAVMWEPQDALLRAYESAGVSVGKIQLSSALECGADSASVAALAAFAEPRYLHQCVIRHPDGATRFVEDLPDLAAALAEAPAPPGSRVRSHFHVPLGAAEVAARPGAPAVRTTTAEVTAALRAAADLPAPPILEVETYTWGVLPQQERPLAEGIAAEVAWAAAAARGAAREPAP